MFLSCFFFFRSLYQSISLAASVRRVSADAAAAAYPIVTARYGIKWTNIHGGWKKKKYVYKRRIKLFSFRREKKKRIGGRL